jgi:phosphopantothenoylcysteine synthetase/decarboxylase
LPRQSRNTHAARTPRTPAASTPPRTDNLAGYELLVCVCGGISAYKTAALVSALVQRSCAVTVAMTRAARRLIGPDTFRGLTGRDVVCNLWGEAGSAADFMPHLRLSETSDMILVAPATANVIGKVAGGLADDLVSTLLLGAGCPILMAPAMNARMWAHPSVQRNVDWLVGHVGVQIIGPQVGWQACGTVGPGRMAEPDEMLAVVQNSIQRRRPIRARVGTARASLAD